MIWPQARWKMQYVATLAVLLVTGCKPVISGRTGPATNPSGSPVSRPISLITPIDFFPPEQKRLSQHLNWNTGCFEVKYSGKPVQVQTRMEVWNNGQPNSDRNSCSAGAGDNEISIAVREEGASAGKGASYRFSTRLSSGNGSSGGSGLLSRPELRGSSSRVSSIPGPLELIRGQEVAVWALMHFKTVPGTRIDDSDSNAPIADQVKAADWAVVLKVTLDPRP